VIENILLTRWHETAFWWNNGVQPNQYGMPGRKARQWGDDTLEGDLDEATLVKNRRDQTQDTAVHKFMDEEYYKTRNFDLESIETPLLSVANWVRVPGLCFKNDY
jgi:hypothetical protein